MMKNKAYPNIIQSLGIIGLFFIFSILFSPFTPSAHIFRLNVELLMLINYSLIAGSTLVSVYFIKRKISGAFKINFFTYDRGYYFMLILASILLLFVSGSIANLIPMPNSFKQVISRLAGQTSIYTFVYFVILAPVFEELIFRGIMLEGMLKRYSPIKSILLSSFFFGIVHLNPWQFITTFLIGCFSGWIYYRAKSILPCIVIHLAANLTGFVIRLLSNTKYFNSMISSSSNDSFFWWIITALALCLFGILVYWLNASLPSPKNSSA